MSEYRPATLDLSEITTDPQRFQFRRALDERHIGVLRRALKSGEPLDPLLVWINGVEPIVVDGHHRLEAYNLQGWQNEVPVEIFEGSQEEATLEALRCNSKDKLPLTSGEKGDAAWRLSDTTQMSVRQIVREAGVSVGTVQNMKTAAKKLRGKGVEPGEYDRWSDARKAAKGDLQREIDIESWQEQIALEWCDRLVDAFGKKAQQQPEIFALALEKYLGRRAAEVRSWLPSDPDDDDDGDGDEDEF